MSERVVTLGLHTTPNYVANYVVKNKRSIMNYGEWLVALIEISYTDRVLFAFSSDLMEDVYKCTLEIVTARRRMIESCYRKTQKNTSLRPNTPGFQLAQNLVNDTFVQLQEYAVANELEGANGPPPPYTTD